MTLTRDSKKLIAVIGLLSCVLLFLFSSTWNNYLDKKKDDSLRKALVDAAEIFDRYHITYWASDGTLLGLFRDGTVIAGDSDVDISIWNTDRMKVLGLKKEFVAKGLTLKETFNAPGKALRLRRDIYAYIDIYLVGRRGPQMSALYNPRESLGYPATFVEELIYVDMEFEGAIHKISLPKGAEDYCVYRYGENWNTPVKNDKGRDGAEPSSFGNMLRTFLRRYPMFHFFEPSAERNAQPAPQLPTATYPPEYLEVRQNNPMVLGESNEAHFAEHVFATLLYSDNYLMAVLVLGKSLDATGTRHPKVVCVTKHVSEHVIDELKRNDWLIRRVDALGHTTEGSDSRFKWVFTKLRLWQMVEFKRIIFLDADIAVQNPLDDLFECGRFCGVYLHPFNFNGGLLVITPDLDEYDRLLKFRDENGSSFGMMGEQTLLNMFYGPEMQTTPEYLGHLPDLKEIPDNDPTVPAQRLPYDYNAESTVHSWYGEWRTKSGTVMAIHYLDKGVKPWTWYSYLRHPINWVWYQYRAELPCDSLLVVWFAVLLFSITPIYVSITTSFMPETKGFFNQLRYQLQFFPLCIALLLSAYIAFFFVPSTQYPCLGWIQFLVTWPLLALLLCKDTANVLRSYVATVVLICVQFNSNGNTPSEIIKLIFVAGVGITIAASEWPSKNAVITSIQAFRLKMANGPGLPTSMQPSPSPLSAHPCTWKVCACGLSLLILWVIVINDRL